jgi:branched-chain amino acid transport system ATP-binding protein
VLTSVSFDVMPGESFLIAGANGSGKSTLLKAIFGILAPWGDGRIIFRPDPMGPALSTRPTFRNLAKGLAYLPQKSGVFDDLTGRENLDVAGRGLSDARLLASRREEVLAFLPAVRQLLNRRVDIMSGGERQMVALAMAMLHRPRLLLLDEPTAGLSPDNVQGITEVLRRTAEDSQTRSLVIVDHQFPDGLSWITRIAKMESGHLAVDASKRTLS